MIVYLVGLQAILIDLYEIGASDWTKLTRITVPLVSPTTFFLLITGDRQAHEAACFHRRKRLATCALR